VNRPIPRPPDTLLCYRDSARVCGPDCMAYITPPNGPDYQGQQWAHCLMLVTAHRTGKHLVLLADAVGQQVKKSVTALADAARINQPPPPTVR
jgi:hypothetical protein